MSKLIKNAIVTVLIAFIISAFSTAASVVITSKEQAVKIEQLEQRMNACRNECNEIKKDIYKPFWEQD